MKKTVLLLHVFSSTGIIALSPANAGTATPYVPGSANENLYKELKKACKDGEKLYSIKLASENLQSGVTIEYELIKSNRGNYSFIGELNYIQILSDRKDRIEEATSKKALKREDLATDAKINTIIKLRSTDLSQEEKQLVMADAGKSAVATYDASMAKRATNRGSYSQRAGVTVADTSLSPADIIE